MADPSPHSWPPRVMLPRSTSPPRAVRPLAGALLTPEELYARLPTLSAAELARHSPAQVLLPDPSSFRASCLNVAFWEQEIFPVTGADPDGLLSRVLRRGVELKDFWRDDQRPPRAVCSNRISSQEDRAFVRLEVAAFLAKGVIQEWNGPEPPHLVLPLFVDRSRSKPRLIWDGTRLNRYMIHRRFKLNTLEVLRYLIVPEAYQIVMDHKSGYHHVGVAVSSRQYFGLHCEGKFYTFAGGLPFGWAPAPYVYQRLSDGIAGYLRARYHIPASVYIDDLWATPWTPEHLRRAGVTGSNLKAAALARAAAYIVLCVQLRAGYFLATDKGQLMPARRTTILGLEIDTQHCTFHIPERKRQDVLDKITQLLQLPNHAKLTAMQSLAGKLTALSIALPPLAACLRPIWAAASTLRHDEEPDSQTERDLVVALRNARQLLSRTSTPRVWPRHGVVHVMTSEEHIVAYYATAGGQGCFRSTREIGGPTAELAAAPVFVRHAAASGVPSTNLTWHWVLQHQTSLRLLTTTSAPQNRAQREAIAELRELQQQRILDIVFSSQTSWETAPFTAPCRMMLTSTAARLLWDELGPFTADLFADEDRAMRNPHTGEQLPFVALLPPRDGTDCLALNALAFEPPAELSETRGGMLAFPPPKLVHRFVALAAERRLRVTLVAETDNFRSAIRYEAFQQRTVVLGEPDSDRTPFIWREPTSDRIVPVALRSTARATTFDFRQFG